MGAKAIPWMPEESAFTMPFAREKPPKGTISEHGLAPRNRPERRQEAASMLPVRTLEVNGYELALDMCAAPGSKTTQLGERLHPHGVVVANEPVSGRLNMLVSNRSRLSLANVVVTQHDGRHFGRLPPPGFDLVLADDARARPTRKNRMFGD